MLTPMGPTSLSVSEKLRRSRLVLNCSSLHEPQRKSFLCNPDISVIHILHCARSNIQGFYRTFALRICSWESEPMKRSDVFRPLQSRRLGQTDLLLSQTVSRFFFLRDTETVFREPSFRYNYRVTCWVSSHNSFTMPLRLKVFISKLQVCSILCVFSFLFRTWVAWLERRWCVIS